MPRTRDGYRVSAQSLQELVTSLNFILARITDRMDQIEGIRGTATIESNLVVGEGTSESDAAQLADVTGRVDTAIATAFASVQTISASWTFTQNVSFTGNIYVYDATSTIIHSME